MAVLVGAEMRHAPQSTQERSRFSFPKRSVLTSMVKLGQPHSQVTVFVGLGWFVLLGMFSRRGITLLKLSVIETFIPSSPLAWMKRVEDRLSKARGEMPSSKLSDRKDYILTAYPNNKGRPSRQADGRKKVPPHGLNRARGGQMLLHQHGSNPSGRGPFRPSQASAG